MSVTSDTFAKATYYTLCGLPGPDTWLPWFVSAGELSPEKAELLPDLPQLRLPEYGSLFHDPFSMKSETEMYQDRTTWLLIRSFSYHSESVLKRVGFSALAAKLLTYYRICFIAAGAGARKYASYDDEVDLMSSSCSLMLDSPAIDKDAFALAEQSWPLVVMTVVGGFIDTGYQFSDQTATLCEKSWGMTQWPKAFEAHDLTWSQLIQFLFRAYVPPLLLASMCHRILTGGFEYAAIYDAVSYSISDACVVPMISPWGPKAAAAWWRSATAFMSAMLLARKDSLTKSGTDLGQGAFSPKVTEWLSAKVHPYLDVLRMVLPIVADTMRTMYMPSISSQLYLSYHDEDKKMLRHARAFSEVVVGQGFAQATLDDLRFSIKDLDVMEKLHEVVSLGSAKRPPYLQNSGARRRSVDELLPWQAPSLYRVTLPTPDDLASISTCEEPPDYEEGLIQVDGVAYVANVKDSTIEGELGGLSLEPVLLPVPVKVRSASASQKEQHAIEIAKRALYGHPSAKTTEGILEILQRPRSNSIFSRVWRPELCHAKRVYDEAQDGEE